MREPFCFVSIRVARGSTKQWSRGAKDLFLTPSVCDDHNRRGGREVRAAQQEVDRRLQHRTAAPWTPNTPRKSVGSILFRYGTQYVQSSSMVKFRSTWGALRPGSSRFLIDGHVTVAEQGQTPPLMPSEQSAGSWGRPGGGLLARRHDRVSSAAYRNRN